MKICEKDDCPHKKICQYYCNLLDMKKDVNYTIEIVKNDKDYKCFKQKEFYGN